MSCHKDLKALDQVIPPSNLLTVKIPPTGAFSNSIVTQVAALVDEKLSTLINAVSQLTLSAKQSSAETLTMHKNLKVSTQELHDRNNEVMQVKLNKLSAQLSSNNESIVSAKKASDEMYNALQDKVDSSSESNKAELNLLRSAVQL